QQVELPPGETRLACLLEAALVVRQCAFEATRLALEVAAQREGRRLDLSEAHGRIERLALVDQPQRALLVALVHRPHGDAVQERRHLLVSAERAPALETLQVVVLTRGAPRHGRRVPQTAQRE